MPRAYEPAKQGEEHATPHMPVETAKCWWFLKIEPNAWAGGKGSCAVCVDLQAVGALELFGELYSLAKGFGPFFRGVWVSFDDQLVAYKKKREIFFPRNPHNRENN